MSMIHLLWIIPLATTFGFILGGIMAIGKLSDNDKTPRT